MTDIDLGEAADQLAAADELLFEGNLGTARTRLNALLRNLPAMEEPHSFEDSIARAVTMHRVAVVEYVSGRFEEAEASFEDVDRSISEAASLEVDADQVEILHDTASWSQETRMRLSGDFDITLPSRIGKLNTIQATIGICTHGCRVAITPCGKTYQHC